MKCDENSGPVTELKVGTEDNQHVVAIEPGDAGKGSKFAIVYLYIAASAAISSSRTRSASTFKPIEIRVLASTLTRALLSDTPLLDSAMEQPCYKCGQVVEEGVPFCPHCSAPQIRVVLAEPAPSPIFAAVGPSQDTAAFPSAQIVPVLALPMQWAEAFRPCALAALVASLLMSMGLNPFVAMFSVGFLAVVFYRQRRRGIRN